ncbi:MAG TPA: response regulator [Methylomirabilota bacterium]|nr:response regulator [Methylomirabilota bacterium]
MTSRLLILHVEDDPNDVLLLQRACKKAGLNVQIEAVGDGDKAVNYLSGVEPYSNREQHPLPTLVLLDLKMPRRSGLEVLAWIRAQPALRRLLVAVFTSSKHDEDINKAYELGANSYLVKPVGFDALVELMKMVNQYWFTINERPSA